MLLVDCWYCKQNRKYFWDLASAMRVRSKYIVMFANKIRRRTWIARKIASTTEQKHIPKKMVSNVNTHKRQPHKSEFYRANGKLRLASTPTASASVESIECMAFHQKLCVAVLPNFREYAKWFESKLCPSPRVDTLMPANCFAHFVGVCVQRVLTSIPTELELSTNKRNRLYVLISWIISSLHVFFSLSSSSSRMHRRI